MDFLQELKDLFQLPAFWYWMVLGMGALLGVGAHFLIVAVMFARGKSVLGAITAVLGVLGLACAGIYLTVGGSGLNDAAAVLLLVAGTLSFLWAGTQERTGWFAAADIFGGSLVLLLLPALFFAPQTGQEAALAFLSTTGYWYQLLLVLTVYSVALCHGLLAANMLIRGGIGSPLGLAALVCALPWLIGVLLYHYGVLPDTLANSRTIGLVFAGLFAAGLVVSYLWGSFAEGMELVTIVQLFALLFLAALLPSHWFTGTELLAFWMGCCAVVLFPLMVSTVIAMFLREGYLAAIVTLFLFAVSLAFAILAGITRGSDMKTLFVVSLISGTLFSLATYGLTVCWGWMRWRDGQATILAAGTFALAASVILSFASMTLILVPLKVG